MINSINLNIRFLFIFSVLILWSSFAQGAGFSSHNSAAKRSAQYEYFGPKSPNFNPESYYGLANDRYLK